MQPLAEYSEQVLQAEMHHHLYLTDFGIASWLGEKPLHNGSLMGTDHYMVPELFNGYMDERSEVYAVIERLSPRFHFPFL